MKIKAKRKAKSPLSVMSTVNTYSGQLRLIRTDTRTQSCATQSCATRHRRTYFTRGVQMCRVGVRLNLVPHMGVEEVVMRVGGGDGGGEGGVVVE